MTAMTGSTDCPPHRLAATRDGPYLYVGPDGGPPPGDPAFWNTPFGAARTCRQIGTVPEATAFFRDARARARATTPTRRTS